MQQPGAHVAMGATHFALRSPQAEAVDLCLFVDAAETRLPMARDGDDPALWRASVPADLTGATYGYRAHGEFAPERGRWFDPAKLLVDPYAVALDRRFAYDPRLSQYGQDTADLAPRAIITGPLPDAAPDGAPAQPLFTPGGVVYEVNVRGFTLLHPDIPQPLRGTVAALACPAIIAHLKRLHVTAIELMPIIAWIDERHLPPLGLRNFWGYNPVAMMALDPGLCPGGLAELRETVAVLHAAGIGIILDIVLNHSGESDVQGPILSLRGLDNAAYAHDGAGGLINDTGCGNTLDFAQGPVRDLAIATLRHFVRHCGVDGFRFDLAPVLARGPGFDAAAPIFAEIAADPWLADRIMIAEPWDIGPGGYQLGHFPANWLEWNDVFRDDVRRFWKGETGMGALATRLAGSADIFGEQACRSVNFIAAHDGFTLADMLAYDQRHNWANGEGNRDGHGDNHSWNNGAEGPSDSPAIIARRAQDARALLGTLFASTGTLLLTAGDEFGRSQQGNNNAYCQDSPIGWVDWAARDTVLEAYVAALSARRAAVLAAHPQAFAQFPRAGCWLGADGAPLADADWAQAQVLTYQSDDPDRPLHVTIDRAGRRVTSGGA